MTTDPRQHPHPRPSLQVWRCRGCGRIIMRAELPPGATVEVKCRDCNTFNTVEIARARQEARHNL